MIFASKPGGSPLHFGRMYDKKVNLLGLLSLVAMPEETTPPQLQNAWPQLMAGTMRLLTSLKEQQVCSTHIKASLCLLQLSLCAVAVGFVMVRIDVVMCALAHSFKASLCTVSDAPSPASPGSVQPILACI